MLQRVIGTNISRFRRERGWTRGELSRAMGISTRYLSLIEKGEANITIAILERAAEALKVSPVELLILPEKEQERERVIFPRRRKKTTRELIRRFLRRHRGEVNITAPRMAKEIRRSERSVWKSLKDMVADGEVVIVQRGGGRGKGNTYRLTIDRPA